MRTKNAKAEARKPERKSEWALRKEGVNAAQEWVRATSPLKVLAFSAAVGPYDNLPRRGLFEECPTRWKHLCQNLRHRGFGHATGFVKEVHEQLGFKRDCLAALIRERGRIDGERWAGELATPQQHHRLQQLAAETDPSWIDSLDVPFVGAWTPGHMLAWSILGRDYPKDDDGYALDDCEAFRSFWQPFSDASMADVLRDLQLEDGSGPVHPIEFPSYIKGFIDGALGISAQLRSYLADLGTAGTNP